MTGSRSVVLGARVSLEYDDFDALDLALGQVHRMLDQDGDARTASLVAAAVLRLRPGDGYYHPMPGDN